jgi:3-deoxy-manno-octulosonate cytidylyltransferase (CMP-KDO synthetase)
MKVTAVIPARYASTRLPGKPLLKIGGRPMIQWVYEGVGRSSLISDVLIATDDQRILDAVHAFGGEGIMTSPDHPTGTDRLAEVAKKLDSEIIVNVQGDEPLIEAEVIDACVRPMLEGGDFPVVTPCTRIRSHEELLNPDVVKVVLDRSGCALYFSRSPVPYDRDESPSFTNEDQRRFFKHIGLYVYRRDFLLTYNQMEPAPLEKRERLEQLRILENGYKIRVVETEYNSVGVDSQKDLERVRNLVKAGKGTA